MTQDSQDGISYLQALKRAAQGDAAVTAGHEPNAADNDAAAASVRPPIRAGAERRRSPRYKCEGSAEIVQDDCNGRTWATFKDISLHGCYVEAMSTYTVGASLQLKLEAQGFRVRCKGTVRVAYPSLGMGIAFTEISEEDRAQLKQLVQTLSRTCVVMGSKITSLPSPGKVTSVPLISNPIAAVQALIEFFEIHPSLARSDFLKILRKSQEAPSR